MNDFILLSAPLGIFHSYGDVNKTGVIVAQYQVSLAMHYGINGALLSELRVVGLGSVLIAYKKTLNDAVNISGVKIN